MNQPNDIILSILIISHNQRDLLKRCFESVLRQELPFRFEIVMSDDHSTDGTWEQIEDYERHYPGIVKGVHCYPEEGNALCNSERCGWNKLTAYLNSSGKYFVNMDADDYLVGTNVYKKSVERLEAHPELSMCFHKVWVLNNGMDWSTGHRYLCREFIDGEIINKKDAILKREYELNQGYVMRRYTDVDMKTIQGKYFNDTPVTLYHFLRGDASYVDCYGYVYVQYHNSIMNSSSPEQRKLQTIVDEFMLVQQVPEYAGLLMKHVSTKLSTLWRERYSKARLPNGPKMTYQEFDGFIFEFYRKKKRSLGDYVHAAFLRYLFYVFRKLHIKYTTPTRLMLLYALNTKFETAKRIPSEYWNY